LVAEQVVAVMLAAVVVLEHILRQALVFLSVLLLSLLVLVGQGKPPLMQHQVLQV
jgi:hypothetical protein